MSQLRITLPITLDHHPSPVRMKLRRVVVKNPPEYEMVPVGGKTQGSVDPWNLRDEFLSWRPEDWERFVQLTGDFGTWLIKMNDFVEWQQIVREALLRPSREWDKLRSRFDPGKVHRLFAPAPITFIWDAVAPAAKIRTTTTITAIVATIQLDVLKGAQFKVCARTDCVSPPFKVEARHKIYCSPECAHLVAVRRSRARAAKNKSSQTTHRSKRAARS